MKLDLVKLHRLLERRGWSAADLYRACVELGYDGKTSRTIEMIVSGQTASPGVLVVGYIAQALGRRVDSLLAKDFSE